MKINAYNFSDILHKVTVEDKVKIEQIELFQGKSSFGVYGQEVA